MPRPLSSLLINSPRQFSGPITATHSDAAHYLAAIKYEEGFHPEAIALLEPVLKAQEARLGPEHPDSILQDTFASPRPIG